MAFAVCAIAADVKIDKNNCTITKDGKTYNLYGKVKIVDSFEDIKVKIVDSFEDAESKSWMPSRIHAAKSKLSIASRTSK